ncbi:polyketide synthase dehydratase domain-containing protein, partial [Streptomyces boncukensis]
VQVVVGAADADGRREVQVYSRAEEEGSGEGSWVCHAAGTLGGRESAWAPALGAEGAWPPAAAEAVDVEGFYERAGAAGYAYGPAFQGVRALWRDGPDLLAEVELPEAAGEPDGYGIHPALLDAALHPAFLLGQDSDAEETGQIWLPFSWTRVSLHASGATTLRVRLTPLQDGGGEEGELGVRVVLADAVGAPVLNAESVVMRAAEPAQLQAARGGGQDTDGLFAVDWTPLPEPYGAEGTWAVLGAGAGRGAVPESASGSHSPDHSPCHYPDLEALAGAIGAGEPAPTAVLTRLAVSDHGSPASHEDGLRAAQDALTLVQSWLAESRLGETRLVVAVRGANAVDGDGSDVDPAAAGVWGLVRSAQSENPDRFHLLDLGPDTELTSDGVAEAVLRAVAADEPQLAVRDGRALVPRLVRADDGGELEIPREGPWCLGTTGTATLENISALPCPEVLEPLEPGQVRIAVRAAGVNFRDVLVGLGMAPGQTGLGSEGAGVVLEVGAEVTRLSAGDEVMGLFEGAFGSVAVADARMVVGIPEGWSWRAAAAVPVVFSTAWFGLVELA